MTRISLGLPFLVAFLISSAALIAGPEPVPLRYRWSMGEPLRYQLVEKMIQRLEGPIESRLDWERTITFSERVVSQTPAGPRIERTFDRVAITATRDGGDPVRYDSASPDPAAADSLLVAPFAALAGGSIRFTFRADGTVTDVDGADEVLDAMFLPLEQEGLAAGIANARSNPGRRAKIAKQIAQALAIIPNATKRPGSSWPVEIDHASPLAGDLSSHLTATLKGHDERTGTAQIAIDGTLSLAPPPDDAPGIIGILGITLESGTISGKIGFNAEAGTIETQETTVSTAWSVGGGAFGGQNQMRQIIEQSAHLKRLR